MILLTGVKEDNKYFIKILGVEIKKPKTEGINLQYLSPSKVKFELVYELEEKHEEFLNFFNERENSESLNQPFCYMKSSIGIIESCFEKLGFLARWIQNENGENETLFLLLPRGLEKIYGFSEGFHLYFFKKNLVNGNFVLEKMIKGLEDCEVEYKGEMEISDLVRRLKLNEEFWSFRFVERMFIFGEGVGAEINNGEIFRCKVSY